MMKGTIEIEDMEFFAYHGCDEEERKNGNRFLVSLFMETDVRQAAESDNIVDALDYQIAYRIVKREMEIPSNLLENVCSRILDALFDEYRTLVGKTTVKVSKLNPPLGGKTAKTSVTLSRR